MTATAECWAGVHGVSECQHMQDGPSQHEERKTLKGRWRLLTTAIVAALSLAATSVWNGVITGGIGAARGFTWEAGKGLWTAISDNLFHRRGTGEPADRPAAPPKTGHE